MNQWVDIVAGIGGTLRDLAAGEVLFRAGDEIRFLFHVERGRIGLFRQGWRGHRVTAGALLAEDSLFAVRYSEDAVAERPSRVRVLSKAAVLLHLRAHPDLNLAFSADLAEQLGRQRHLAGILRLPQARDRVTAWLAAQGIPGETITLDRPLMALAEEIGLTHEALYRTLAALVAEGRLERPGKRSFRLRA